MRAVEFLLREPNSAIRIGQCAVLQIGRRFILQEGLQLLPNYRSHWRDAMTLLLSFFGNGNYRYGGIWTRELDRLGDIEALQHVSLTAYRPLVLQTVDFSRWINFDHYWSQVSENVRRNARTAEQMVPKVTISRPSRRATLGMLPELVRLQHASMTRKGLTVARLRQAARIFFSLILNGRAVELSVARDEAGMLAFFYLARAGKLHFYLFGGRRADASGAAWYLMKDVFRRAIESAPDGAMVMGNVDYSIHSEATGGGLIRARRSLRATDSQISIIDFDYRNQ